MTEPMLRVRGLSVRRGRRVVLRDVGFEADAGSITCVLGPNGAGKSTLLKAVAGLLPCEGERTIGGADIGAMSTHERAKAMAYVPQQSALDAPLDVATVVAQGRYAHTGGLGAPSAKDRAAVGAALARTDLSALAGRRFDRLSVGERRRVLLARALATEAKIVLLDEPTAALDVRHALELHALLRELADDGFCVLVVLHALDDARRHTDRALLIDRGALLASGPSAEVVDEERVRDVYGVELVENGALGFHLGAGS